ncbi:MAG: hypothetical protein ABJB12_23235 [Pseudomonadota bacterium]
MPDFENKSRTSEPYLPPPPESPEDSSPESLHMPRLDPPPASLEAMVRSRPGSAMPGEERRGWVWISVVIAVVAAAAYVIDVYR